MVLSKKNKKDTKELMNDVEDVFEDVEEIKEAIDGVVERIENIKEDAVEVINDVVEHLGLSKKEEEEELLLKQKYLELEKIKGSIWGKGGYYSIKHNMENKTLDILIEELTIKILKSIKTHQTDYDNLHIVVKDIIYNLKTQLLICDVTEELFGKTKPDTFYKHKYIVMKMKIKNPHNNCILCNHKNKTKTIHVKFCILTPLNQKAIDECEKFMKPQIKNIIKKLKKNNK